MVDAQQPSLCVNGILRSTLRYMPGKFGNVVVCLAEGRRKHWHIEASDDLNMLSPRVLQLLCDYRRGAAAAEVCQDEAVIARQLGYQHAGGDECPLARHVGRHVECREAGDGKPDIARCAGER